MERETVLGVAFGVKEATGTGLERGTVGSCGGSVGLRHVREGGRPASRADISRPAGVAGCAPVGVAESKHGDALDVEGGDLVCRPRQLCPGL